MSLRDVERTMIVFIYFFEKMPLLREAIEIEEVDSLLFHCILLIILS